jgi:PhzF family phenazine biosynthesis protein
MNMKYTLYQIDAFTTQRFGGNPAGVVSNADGLTDVQMQDIARELNNSETAFILSPTATDHEVWIRFFTPAIEVPSCGHATISAHFVRAIERNLPSCTVIQKIGIGILPVEILRQDSDYKIVMTQGKIEFSPPLTEPERSEIIAALGLSEINLDHRCPVQIVSTGHSKVLIGIKNIDVLQSLKPNLTSLAALSERIKCNGYFVFTIDPDSDDVLTHGRMFAPAIGIPEDPVTGNANGPLGAYAVKHHLVKCENGTYYFKAKQGEAMGREGIAEVEVEVQNGEPMRVKVGGKAVVVFKTDIEI